MSLTDAAISSAEAATDWTLAAACSDAAATVVDCRDVSSEMVDIDVAVACSSVACDVTELSMPEISASKRGNQLLRASAAR